MCQRCQEKAWNIFKPCGSIHWRSSMRQLTQCSPLTPFNIILRGRTILQIEAWRLTETHNRMRLTNSQQTTRSRFLIKHQSRIWGLKRFRSRKRIMTRMDAILFNKLASSHRWVLAKSRAKKKINPTSMWRRMIFGPARSRSCLTSIKWIINPLTLSVRKESKVSKWTCWIRNLAAQPLRRLILTVVWCAYLANFPTIVRISWVRLLSSRCPLK